MFWRYSGLINRLRGRRKPVGSKPPPSALFLRTLSPRGPLIGFLGTNVIGLASSPSAASQIAYFSAFVSGILMSSSRRSSGAFGRGSAIGRL